MKKITLIIAICFILTGCTVKYDIHFDELGITEKIEGTIEGNIYEMAKEIDGDGYYFQQELVNNKIPALKNYKKYYNKKISVNGNNSNVFLNHRYKYEEIKDSYIINRCFEKVSIINDKEYLYVSLGGNFQCFDFENDNIEVQVSSNYQIIEHNAKEEKNGKYIWDINIADKENKIEFQLLKKTKEKETNKLNTLRIVVLILIILTGIILLIIKKSIKNN